MLKYRNFGKKSLNEIKDKLTALGLGLGMKFDPGLVETPVGVDVAASSNGTGTEQPSRVGYFAMRHQKKTIKLGRTARASESAAGKSGLQLDRASAFLVPKNRRKRSGRLVDLSPTAKIRRSGRDRFRVFAQRTLMLDQAANLICQQRFPMLGRRPSFIVFFWCRIAKLATRDGCSVPVPLELAATSTPTGGFHQTGIKFHSQPESEGSEFVLNFVKRFLAEVPILQHFRLGFLGELAHGGDIGVVQTIGGADAQLDFVHAHVEKLLQFHVLFAYSGGRLIELDHVFVEIDEDIEVMPQNS